MVFAMAGLEEMAILYELRLITSVLIVIVVMLGFAWWFRSIEWTSIAAAALLPTGMLLQPWTAFQPPSSDPDDVYWTFWMRVESGFWALVVVLAATCLIAVIRRKRSGA